MFELMEVGQWLLVRRKPKFVSLPKGISWCFARIIDMLHVQNSEISKHKEILVHWHASVRRQRNKLHFYVDINHEVQPLVNDEGEKMVDKVKLMEIFGRNLVSLTKKQEHRETGSGKKDLESGFLTFHSISKICEEKNSNLVWEDPRKNQCAASTSKRKVTKPDRKTRRVKQRKK